MRMLQGLFEAASSVRIKAINGSMNLCKGFTGMLWAVGFKGLGLIIYAPKLLNSMSLVRDPTAFKP